MEVPTKLLLDLHVEYIQSLDKVFPPPTLSQSSPW